MDGELIRDRDDPDRFITRNYTTQPEKVNGKSVRVYPNLIANPLYFQVLQELEDDKELNQ